MNRSLALRLAALAFLPLCAPFAWADEAAPPVAVKVDGLSPFVAIAVQDKARQGITELRRYVERTRMIHALYLPDLIRPDEEADVVAATPAVQVTRAKTGVARTSVASASRAKTVVASTRQISPVKVAKATRAPTTQSVKALARAGAPVARA